jgi:hypothetical protein
VHATGSCALPYDVNDQRELDRYPAAGRPAERITQIPLWKRLFWEGGRPFDAFLTIVSAQVGQVILSLVSARHKSVCVAAASMIGPLVSISPALVNAGADACMTLACSTSGTQATDGASPWL